MVKSDLGNHATVCVDDCLGRFDLDIERCDRRRVVDFSRGSEHATRSLAEQRCAARDGQKYEHSIQPVVRYGLALYHSVIFAHRALFVPCLFR